MKIEYVEKAAFDSIGAQRRLLLRQLICRINPDKC